MGQRSTTLPRLHHLPYYISDKGHLLQSPMKTSEPPHGSSKSSKVQIQQHHRLRRLVRAFLLLLLTVYAVTVYLRFATTDPAVADDHPNPTPTTSHDRRTIPETSVPDSSSLKTHLSSESGRLQAQLPSEKPPHASTSPSPIDAASCRTMIDGTSTTVNATIKDSSQGIMCCDRSHHRTDVCYMKGDIRTEPKLNTIYLHGASISTPQTIRPYTRKWETSIMATVDELTLIPQPPSSSQPLSTPRACDVTHRVPAIVMSTGGYTGNVYHEFNDGLLPLFITAERFHGEVVLLLLEYHPWWVAKYGSIVKKISRYPPVDLKRDRRVHCFPEMIVGMKIHGELTVDPTQMPSGKGMADFQALIDEAFRPNYPDQTQAEPDQIQLPTQLPILVQQHRHQRDRPTIAIFVRHRSRVLTNLRAIARRCQKSGFSTVLIDPKRNTPMSKIHAAVSNSDAMLAVHGAAVTHFLFMRPATTLLQIVPLGLDWAAEEYYGAPAKKMGLKYVVYKVTPQESSLFREYGKDDPVIKHPEDITSRGWQETKRVYLQHQNVTVDLKRFDKVLAEVMSQVRQRRSGRLGIR